jgi:hypothetical protein
MESVIVRLKDEVTQALKCNHSLICMQVKDHLQEVEKKDQEIYCLKLQIQLQKETNDNLFRELNMSIE